MELWLCGPKHLLHAARHEVEAIHVGSDFGGRGLVKVRGQSIYGLLVAAIDSPLHFQS